MCFDGVWGTVCADGWNEIAANVVCSQLGYSTGNYSGFSYQSSASYMFLVFLLSIKGTTHGNFPLLFNNIVCSENYSMLSQCIDVHNFSIDHYCENGTAEVICEMPNASSENMESVSDTMSTSVSII